MWAEVPQRRLLLMAYVGTGGGVDVVGQEVGDEPADERDCRGGQEVNRPREGSGGQGLSQSSLRYVQEG